MKSRNPKGAAPLARQSAPGPRELPARLGCAERRGQAGLPGTNSLPPAEAEDWAHAEAEIVLLCLAEVGAIIPGFHADTDQFGDADVHGEGDQHGELGLVQTGISGGGQLE